MAGCGMRLGVRVLIVGLALNAAGVVDRDRGVVVQWRVATDGGVRGLSDVRHAHGLVCATANARPRSLARVPCPSTRDAFAAGGKRARSRAAAPGARAARRRRPQTHRAQAQPDRPAARRQQSARTVDVAAQLATELLADIRGVVAQIRQHDGLDVRAALAQLIAPLPQPPRIHLQIDDDARADNVAQAETRAARGAGSASPMSCGTASAQNAWVEMRRDGASLRLQVRDDGRGRTTLAGRIRHRGHARTARSARRQPRLLAPSARWPGARRAPATHPMTTPASHSPTIRRWCARA